MKNRTMLYGEGLFETFRVCAQRRLPFVEDHLDRMADGCAFFGLPFSREDAARSLKTALGGIPSHVEARLRLDLVCYGDLGIEKVDFHTSWEPLSQGTPGVDGSLGVELDFAPFPRFSESPLVRFKTASYLENIFCFRWARSRGLFDVLFTNERGELTEGSISNVFFLGKEEDRLWTPSLDAGLLPGITRRHVMETAEALSLSVEESRLFPSDPVRFGGAFVTNSVVGILPVRSLADRDYNIPDAIRSIQEGYDRKLEMSCTGLEAFTD